MKKHAPAAARNRDAIADVLARELPQSGMVLEVASGSGEHSIHFAARFPKLNWQPSDPDEAALASISAWQEDSDLPNLKPPVELDATQEFWPIEQADAMLCINMVHISPWRATEGLFAAAARILGHGAPLILYGPYLEKDVQTTPSNLDFDANLRGRNREWGLRDLADMDDLAGRNGFGRSARYAMPANNLTLVFRRD